MPCAKCGAAVSMKESHGGTKSGHFQERYECARGHTGTISGDVEDMPHKWNRYGEVFESYE